LLIVWGVASAAGWLAMAALMIMGDWTVLQGLFAAAVIFFGLGAVLSFLFLRPLSEPAEAARMAHAEPAPTVPAMAPLRSGKPTAAAASAPAKTAASETRACARARPLPQLRRRLLPQPIPGKAPGPPRWMPRATAGRTTSSGSRASGPKLEKLCNSLGFYHFDQIANWTADEVAWVDQNLEGFKGRVTRDNWVEQARLLASGGETEFSKKVDKGDVY
jgi:hypothetical protein